MRSAARCTYSEVHRVLSGEDVSPVGVRRPTTSKAFASSVEQFIADMQARPWQQLGGAA